MGAIQAKKLDVTIMNREAYDIFSQKGYLADLSELLSGIPDLREQIKPLLTENEVIISDNSLEVMLREAEEEIRVTETVQNAIDLSSLTLFQNAGFDGEVYLGLVANTPRKDMAVRFIQYLSVS